uniref:Secreted protein n=1 Tax=Heterorhabditis bacteriophora TaxID=37862 RepID=A0A1I7X0N6_HETBA
MLSINSRNTQSIVTSCGLVIFLSNFLGVVFLFLSSSSSCVIACLRNLSLSRSVSLLFGHSLRLRVSGSSRVSLLSSGSGCSSIMIEPISSLWISNQSAADTCDAFSIFLCASANACTIFFFSCSISSSSLSSSSLNIISFNRSISFTSILSYFILSSSRSLSSRVALFTFLKNSIFLYEWVQLNMLTLAPLLTQLCCVLCSHTLFTASLHRVHLYISYRFSSIGNKTSLAIQHSVLRASRKHYRLFLTCKLHFFPSYSYLLVDISVAYRYSAGQSLCKCDPCGRIYPPLDKVLLSVECRITRLLPLNRYSCANNCCSRPTRWVGEHFCANVAVNIHTKWGCWTR